METLYSWKSNGSIYYIIQSLVEHTQSHTHTKEVEWLKTSATVEILNIGVTQVVTTNMVIMLLKNEISIIMLFKNLI